MCLERVGRVVSVADDGTAVADFGGVRRPVSLVIMEMEGRTVTVGAWLLVHSGIAVRPVRADEAGRILRLRDEANGERR